MRGHAKRAALGVLGAGLMTSCLAHAWGDEAHGWLALHGVDALPPSACLRSWVASLDAGGLAEAAAEPDAWRSPQHPQHHPDEGPAHYLDVDAAEPPERYPREWPAVLARFGPERGRKLGRVPWKVEEARAALVFRFREDGGTGAARAYAHLSHYVSDAFSPLHSTLAYNPRWGPEDAVGLHERYEVLLWQRPEWLQEVGQRALARLRLPARVSPRSAIFEALFSGLSPARKLARVDAAEKGELQPLYVETSALTAERWAKALGLLAALTDSAWKEAGSPRLPGMVCSKDGADTLRARVVTPGSATVHPPTTHTPGSRTR